MQSTGRVDPSEGLTLYTSLVRVLPLERTRKLRVRREGWLEGHV